MAAQQIKNEINAVLTTANATLTTLLTIPVPAGATLSGFGTCCARNVSAGTSASWNIVFGTTNISGTVTATITPTAVLSTLLATLTGAVSGTNIVFNATGIAATNIDWFIDIQYIIN